MGMWCKQARRSTLHNKAPDAGNRVIARYTGPVQNEISSNIEG
jgi:hypothetical protein